MTPTERAHHARTYSTGYGHGAALLARLRSWKPQAELALARMEADQVYREAVETEKAEVTA